MVTQASRSAALVALAAALAAPGGAVAADALSGELIARQWCAECHVVADDQPTASVDVPTFRQIAREFRFDAGELSAFLADPHPQMPQMSLTRREIADLVAFIDSLRRPDTRMAD